jgi:hypothetical protein
VSVSKKKKKNFKLLDGLIQWAVYLRFGSMGSLSAACDRHLLLSLLLRRFFGGASICTENRVTRIAPAMSPAFDHVFNPFLWHFLGNVRATGQLLLTHSHL